MKYWLLFFIVVCTLDAKAQIFTYNTAEGMPLFFIDSVKFKVLPFFAVDKIADLQIVGYKEGSKVYVNGEMYFKLKNSKSLNLLTLDQIAKNYGIHAKSLIYMVDGQFVRDTSDIKIDSSYVYKCLIHKSGDFKYLNVAPLTILNVLTRNKENLDRDTIRYIKGISPATADN
ncbi:hypothetical protein GS399_01305 [Pedobacter sp. HMF7647]|uniref:Uncharacterized protein n=1 Tax=Hufsiella arboris TaxID=2695275 RepID=A0A7K1Y4U3_9SPHI|nr:hypothetical protein [Hufsiella arboris]MXV49594.1 hypothetical protein [Hufsiella arboris]